MKTLMEALNKQRTPPCVKCRFIKKCEKNKKIPVVGVEITFIDKRGYPQEIYKSFHKDDDTHKRKIADFILAYKESRDFKVSMTHRSVITECARFKAYCKA